MLRVTEISTHNSKIVISLSLNCVTNFSNIVHNKCSMKWLTRLSLYSFVGVPPIYDQSLKMIGLYDGWKEILKIQKFRRTC
ncbi:hypothetical protein LXL04_003939 [Taraxacum kok-saghyz]